MESERYSGNSVAEPGNGQQQSAAERPVRPTSMDGVDELERRLDEALAAMSSAVVELDARAREPYGPQAPVPGTMTTAAHYAMTAELLRDVMGCIRKRLAELDEANAVASRADGRADGRSSTAVQ